MSTVVRRSIAAAATVVVAAVTGVATNVATDDAGAGWWVALGVLVVLGVALQVYLTVSSSDGGVDVTAAGAGSVAIGDSLRGSVKTKASGAADSAGTAPGQGGTTAAGPGSVAVGKDVDGPIETDVTP